MTNDYKQKIAIFTLFVLLIPNLAFGAEVDYNNIISDSDADNYQSMTMSEIRDFLRSQDSYLQNYEYSGNNPSPAQVVL